MSFVNSHGTFVLQYMFVSLLSRDTTYKLLKSICRHLDVSISVSKDGMLFFCSLLLLSCCEILGTFGLCSLLTVLLFFRIQAWATVQIPLLQKTASGLIALELCPW